MDIKKTSIVDCPCKEELDAKICTNLRPIKHYQLCVSKIDNSPTITTSGLNVINIYIQFLWNIVKAKILPILQKLSSCNTRGAPVYYREKLKPAEPNGGRSFLVGMMPVENMYEAIPGIDLKIPSLFIKISRHYQLQTHYGCQNR